MTYHRIKSNEKWKLLIDMIIDKCEKKNIENFTKAEIWIYFNVSDYTINKALDEMIKHGTLEKFGKGRGAIFVFLPLYNRFKK